MSQLNDKIKIKGLRVISKIGETEEERSSFQSLKVNVSLYLSKNFSEMNDEIEDTTNYFIICEKIRELSSQKERKLIETLVEDLAKELLLFKYVIKVKAEVQKFIIPDCDSVSVSITRT